ncbi:SMAD/FHA domain-containing protein [Aureobasidium pullulans]|uniref:SMAD/FHA domain-containing protein n=1 Tax=Aureobasidium pullulans TaxID=5580 RepID=A0A4S9BYT9_AURPU|nr:SMAD/FHA domain-containing protein [Aureobasidium pullulans]
MFGNYSPAAASLSTVSSAANTPASPTRPSRLRGLSYLRSYTHNHLHSNSSTSPSSNQTNNPSFPATPTRPPTLSRSTSSPARSARETTSSPPPRSDTAANGWVPTVAGQSGLSRVATQPQSTQSDSPTPTMTRTRAATVNQDLRTDDDSSAPPTAPTTEFVAVESAPAPAQATSADKKEAPTIRFIPHHEPRASRPSLTFPIVTRTIAAAGQRVKVGRYSERDQAPDAQASAKTAAPVGFKSKVVSRRHCELWCDNGQWFIKDVKSSSGTFLNHVRLSSPGMESRAYPLNDGDIVQLGIDFKGGEEVIFRCVKIRIECNRGWQKSLNQFNTATHKNILKQAKVNTKDSDAQSTHSSECSICLNPVAPCQALFVAPCSHVWHYKCVRTLIYPSWPSFQCPNCRAYADLEADVEPPEEEYESDDAADALKASETTQPKSPEPEPLPAIETGGLEDEDLTAMMNSVSIANPSGTDSSSEGEAGPSRGSVSQPVPILASTNAPVNRNLPESIMARSATPTSTAPFALAAATLVPMGDGQNTPRNDAGPFLFDNNPRRATAQRNVADIAREPVHEEAEEHLAQ